MPRNGSDTRLQDGSCLAQISSRPVLQPATNRFRRDGGASRCVAIEALEQYCRHAVKGHAGSRQVVDNRWIIGGCAYFGSFRRAYNRRCAPRLRAQPVVNVEQIGSVPEPDSDNRPTDNPDPRDLCELECSDLPAGQHHPKSSQYILSIDAHDI